MCLLCCRDDQHQNEGGSKRILQVLLDQLDGLSSQKDSFILIGATNRPGDLDSALRNRFSQLSFGRPSDAARADILKQYAQHLSPSDLLCLAQNTRALTGRDLSEVCSLTGAAYFGKVFLFQRTSRAGWKTTPAASCSCPEHRFFVRIYGRRGQCHVMFETSMQA